MPYIPSLLKSKSNCSSLKQSEWKSAMQLPDLQKYDTTKLFQQFTRQFVKQKKTDLTKNDVNNDYKSLLATLKKNNQQKQIKMQKIQQTKKYMILNANSRINNSNLGENKSIYRPLSCNILKRKEQLCQKVEMSTSKAKFTIISNQSFLPKCLSKPIQNVSKLNVQPKPCISTVIPTSQSLCAEVCTQAPIIQSINEEILMVETEQTKLQQQISSLKSSLNHVKKQLDQVNKQLLIEKRNQEKYKHILYLTTSVDNQTDYIHLQNVKGYHSMANRFDQTISQLKKFKSNLRKQKDEMQNEFITHYNNLVDNQKQLQLKKKRELTFSSTSTPQSVRNRHRQSLAKMPKKFIDQLQDVLQLLQQKQPDFDRIKEEQCTKIRLGKIKKHLLQEERVQILDRIQMFQNKYDIKMTSLENLILTIYRMLKEGNERLEEECVKYTQMKDQLCFDLKAINRTNDDYINSHFAPDNLISEQRQNQVILKNLRKNSLVFIKIIWALSAFLLKFRRIFSISLALNMQKKTFKQCIMQIDSLFSSGIFFNFTFTKNVLTTTQQHDIINDVQFRDMLIQKGFQSQIAKELTQLMFNDLRINLIVHRSWLQAKVKTLTGNMVMDLMEVVQTVRLDCEDIYKMKLPTLSNLFLNCFKQISMSKYQLKLANSNQQRDSLFMPMGPVNRYQSLDFFDQSYADDKQNQDTPSHKRISSVEQKSLQQEHKFEKNPRKIIESFEEIKNKGRTKFRALNFACEAKAYQYNHQIVIPHFSLKDYDQF